MTVAADAAPEALSARLGSRRSQGLLRPLFRNRLVLLGAIAFALLIFVALAADVVAPYDPVEVKMADALRSPYTAHVFGTDRYGRDILSRVIFGSRVSLAVALSSIALAMVVGTFLGLIGGYVGGWADIIIGRCMDVFFSFPPLLLAIAIAAILGPTSMNAVIAISVVYAPSSAASSGEQLLPSATRSTSRRRTRSGCPTPASSHGTLSQTCCRRPSSRRPCVSRTPC